MEVKSSKRDYTSIGEDNPTSIRETLVPPTSSLVKDNEKP